MCASTQLTQHAAGHQDVKECLCIPAVVKLGARGIKELRDRFQISASLIQALYDTFLKLSRVKSLLFICWGGGGKGKHTCHELGDSPIRKAERMQSRKRCTQTSFPRFETLAC